MESLPNHSSLKYQKATSKVKLIKGFYFHLFLYLVTNIAWFLMLFFLDQLHSYSLYGFWGMGYGHASMAVFWGIGLLLHGVLVFGRDWPLSKKWEERKVQEIMDKDRQFWE